MTNLPEFLLARIAEDEEKAREAAGWDRAGRQRATGRWQRAGISSVEDDEGLSVIFDDDGRVSGDVADHIARHDPARVLAECEAKREMVEDLRDELANQHDPEPTTLQLAERMLLVVALPYADHPDWREEWRL